MYTTEALSQLHNFSMNIRWSHYMGVRALVQRTVASRLTLRIRIQVGQRGDFRFGRSVVHVKSISCLRTVHMRVNPFCAPACPSPAHLPAAPCLARDALPTFSESVSHSHAPRKARHPLLPPLLFLLLPLSPPD